jgi:hypothetical protein
MAYTLMPEPNQTYLVQTKNVVVPTDPLSGSTVGLMMVLSSFQYQSPTLNTTYSSALNQASHAAFVEVGGQAFQDKTTSYATRNGTDFAHSIGLTDGEMGLAAFTLRTVQRKQINLNGPKVYGIKGSLTLTPNSYNVGFKYEY